MYKRQLFLILVDGRIVVDDNEEGVAVLRLDCDELLVGCLVIELSLIHISALKEKAFPMSSFSGFLSLSPIQLSSISVPSQRKMCIRDRL